MSEPKIVEFQIQLDEFLFLGIEYVITDSYQNMKAVWDRFFKAGGFEKIWPYEKKPYKCMVVNHNNNPEYPVYFIGSIVEGAVEVPDGYTLTKFPACEYIVVTHEWVPTKEEALGQIGRIDEAKLHVQIPDGYVRFDGPESQIRVIENETMDTSDGSRWENWVPIKKLTESAYPRNHSSDT